MASKGISIHIGLNHVDPNSYNGWDGALSGCLNDARDMCDLARALGYSARLITDADATADRVVSEIGAAAQQLSVEDILFLTYSGHGGQVPDLNGDEDEGQDETWVLWDRQLIDDELAALWSHFSAGVRIVMLSDSCHSGTVMRMLAASREAARPSKKRPMPDGTAKTMRETLNRMLLGPAREGPPAAVPAGTSESVDLNARYRIMPGDIQDLVNSSHARNLGAAQFLAGPEEKAAIGASVLLISGCQDWQLSMDGNANGLFTEKVKRVWNSGAFQGDYRSFWNQVKAQMPATQQPNLATTGAPNAAFESQRPFSIPAPAGAVAPTPSAPVTPAPAPEPSSTGARPTLRRGSSGPDVVFLQQRLMAFGYYVTADGQFGPMTESAVRSFQAANGLVADGVVGDMTWAQLGTRQPALEPA